MDPKERMGLLRYFADVLVDERWATPTPNEGRASLLLVRAADEIERLRAEVDRYRAADKRLDAQLDYLERMGVGRGY